MYALKPMSGSLSLLPEIVMCSANGGCPSVRGRVHAITELESKTELYDMLDLLEQHHIGD